MARYAELDFTSKTGQRHGLVLPAYPQVEIAILPASPATSVQVRLVIWGLYSAVVDRVVTNQLRDAEVVLLWQGRPAGYMYFTTPAANSLISVNLTHALDSNVLNLTTSSGISSSTSGANDIFADAFAWTPVFRPNARSLPPKDAFLVCMAVIKAIAPHSGTDKVESPFHVESAVANANMQIYFHRRAVPRTKPPYLDYGVVLEAIRRIPAWLLLQRKFAESFFSVFVYARPLGHLTLEKGSFNPGGRQLDSES